MELVSNINCLHPTIILNPLFEDLVRQYHNYYFRGRRINVTSIYRTPSYVKPQVAGITDDDLKTCYILTFKGRKEPMYMKVRCGHCHLCTESKANSFVQRCMLETQNYNCKPIFLTLTYGKKPKNGVCLRDTQLFFKRLRINLHRQGYRTPIRYCIVAEYGTRTARPHYHAVLWNLHQSDFLSYKSIRDIVEKSWHNGFIRMRLIDPSDDKAFRYTAKYLRKSGHTPEGANKTFMACSNRNGGIGAPYLRKRVRDLQHTAYSRQLQFRNRFGNKPIRLSLDTYCINIVFPSVSKSIPVRPAVRRFMINYHTLLSRSDVNVVKFKKFVHKVFNYYSKFFYVLSPQQANYTPTDLRHSMTILNEFLRDYHALEDDMRTAGNRDNVLDNDRKRKEYVDYLLLHPVTYNLSSRSYRIKRMREFARQREQL